LTTAVDLYPTFWALWIATAVAAGFQVLRPLVTREGLLGFPFVAGLAWLYFYVYMAFDVATKLRDSVPAPALCLGQFVALISYLGLVVGWEIAVRKRSAVGVRSDHNQYPADKLWQGGMLFLVIGIIGQYSLSSQESIGFSNVSAYWHMLYLIGDPGAALCIAGLLRTPREKRPGRIVALTIAVVLLQIPFLMGARRGPLFPAVIVMGFAPFLFTGRKPRRAFVITALGGAGVTMLLFLAIRPYIYSTEQTGMGGWGQALSELTPDNAFQDRGASLGDNEFAYNCGGVWTLYRTGLYQYGTGYLTLLTHWIPRQLWPDKPTLGEGLFPSVYGEIPNEMGWQLTVGAAWGGPADSFEEFGFLCPLFWAALAYFVGRSYRHALSHHLREQMIYLGVIAATHWLVAQGFGAAFVPLCIFTIPPVVFLRWARINPSLSPRRWLPNANRRRVRAALVPFGTIEGGRPIGSDTSAI
jgi:hypothetical protein